MKTDALTKELASKSYFFDTETTSTEEMKAEIVGISLAIKEGQDITFPLVIPLARTCPLKM